MWTARPATPTGGELDEGLAQAREAIRLEPDLPLAYQVLSYGLAEAGDYAGGMRAAERAVELNPNDPDSLMALAKAQVRFGAYEEAVSNAALARRLHPMAPDYYPYVHAQALYAAERVGRGTVGAGDCLLKAPEERNCLRMEAAALVAPRARRARRARPWTAWWRSIPTFSLAVERRLRRFGDFAGDGALSCRPRRRRRAAGHGPGGPSGAPCIELTCRRSCRAGVVAASGQPPMVQAKLRADRLDQLGVVGDGEEGGA